MLLTPRNLFSSVCATAACGFFALEIQAQVNTNFETNPLGGGGWAALNGLGASDWTTEQSFSPTHSIKAHDGGYWFGPGFATQSFSFYKATFKSRTTNGGGTWGTPDNNRPRYTA